MASWICLLRLGNSECVVSFLNFADFAVMLSREIRRQADSGETDAQCLRSWSERCPSASNAQLRRSADCPHSVVSLHTECRNKPGWMESTPNN